MSDLISRQAALEAIQARADMELAEVNHYYLMGFQEAAEAVESVPDAQPEERTNERTETHACDLIGRQAAIDAAIEAADDWDGGCSKERDRFIRDALEELPSAQPEPEEDCDTCKHGYFGDSQCNNCRVRFPSHYEREEEYHGSD